MSEAATGEEEGEEAAAASGDLVRLEKVTPAAVRRLCKTAEKVGVLILALLRKWYKKFSASASAVLPLALQSWIALLTIVCSQLTSQPVS